MKKTLLSMLLLAVFSVGVSNAYIQDNNGCCSYHGGINYLGSKGVVLCNDGQVSQTCTSASFNFKSCSKNDSSCLAVVNPSLCNGYYSDGHDYLRDYFSLGYTDSSLEADISKYISHIKKYETMGAGSRGDYYMNEKQTAGEASFRDSICNDAQLSIINKINENNKEQEIRQKVNTLLSEGDYYSNILDYKNAISKYEEAYNTLKKSNNTNKSELLSIIKKGIDDSKELQEHKNIINNLIDKETKAVNYVKDKEYSKAYNLFKDILTYKDKYPEYNYSQSETFVHDLGVMLEAENQLKLIEEAEQKAKAEAEKKAVQDAENTKIERAKNYLGSKATTLETLSKSPKLKDSKVLKKILAICNMWKNSKREDDNAYGIYLEYLLK